MTYNPLNILRRRARAKGFGVHSPFAYKFITEVLSEHLSYYDYDKLSGKCDRTLYRIAVYFHPAAVYAPCAGDAKVAFMACMNAAKADAEHCDMAIFSSAEDMDTILRCADRQCNTVLIGEGRQALGSLKNHLDAIQCGMLFDNTKDICVIVPNHKLPRQNFELRF